MISLIEDKLAGISLLHVVKAELHKESLPTVLYYHGFNGEKISSLTLAYKIAEKGYRVILPDCMYHGSRQEEMTSVDMDLAFWDIVTKTIDELPELRKALVDEGYSKEEQFGIGGTSMGGIVTYGALVRYPWIQCASVLMGTAYMTDYAKLLMKEFNKMNERQITENEKLTALETLAPDDLSLHPHTLKNRPLFIWHGEEDEVVPYKYSPSFYEAILDYYKDKKNIRFVSESGRSHHISKLAMNETAAWFELHL